MFPRYHHYDLLVLLHNHHKHLFFSDFGKEIESITSSGKLVSDEIIIRLVSDKLKTIPDNRPFILDGFHRIWITSYIKCF